MPKFKSASGRKQKRQSASPKNLSNLQYRDGIQIEEEFAIPKNVIQSLYALWKDEWVEWGGGLDFESTIFEAEQGEKEMYVEPPITTERIILKSGETNEVELVPDMEDIEIFFHSHPKRISKNEPIKAEIYNKFNEFFSFNDFTVMINRFHLFPKLQKKPHLYHLLIGATGKLFLMKVPVTTYNEIYKEFKKRSKDIKEFRSQISNFDLRTPDKKSLKGLSDWELFVFIKTQEIKENILGTACKMVGGHEIESVKISGRIYDPRSAVFDIYEVPEERQSEFVGIPDKLFKEYLEEKYGVSIQEFNIMDFQSKSPIMLSKSEIV